MSKQESISKHSCGGALNSSGWTGIPPPVFDDNPRLGYLLIWNNNNVARLHPYHADATIPNKDDLTILSIISKPAINVTLSKI
mmetsp:Transcript_4213/g.12049  ORF Transcript_4213/g.12049 Transcript_4213/m.12049 type:complete len:83 (+) Transcript_4213:17-265(+)